MSRLWCSLPFVQSNLNWAQTINQLYMTHPLKSFWRIKAIKEPNQSIVLLINIKIFNQTISQKVIEIADSILQLDKQIISLNSEGEKILGKKKRKVWLYYRKYRKDIPPTPSYDALWSLIYPCPQLQVDDKLDHHQKLCRHNAGNFSLEGHIMIDIEKTTQCFLLNTQTRSRENLCFPYK